MESLVFDRDLRSSLAIPLTGSTEDFDDPSPGALSPGALAVGAPASLFKSARLVGTNRVRPVDVFIRRARYEAAFDLASFLAASPDLAEHDASLGLKLATYFRLLAALAAIHGGLYRRAQLTLHTAINAVEFMDVSDPVASLLAANASILLCRFCQVQGLPRFAIEQLKRADEQLDRAKREVVGSALFKARTELDYDPASALARLEGIKSDVVKSWQQDPDSHLFGSYASHYFYYLRGRAHLELKQWNNAKSDFDLADAELRAVHSPVRSAFVELGRARSLVGDGKLTGDLAMVSRGLKDLRSSMATFGRLGFAPGEYEASRFWLDEADLSSFPADALLRFRKHGFDLATQSGVVRFRLEAGVAYAKALFEYGRPLAASSVLHGLTTTTLDGPFKELETHPMRLQAEALEKATVAALDNSVAPTEAWGLSRYAKVEQEFVNRIRESTIDAVVSISGPPGSGRRVLASRIAKAWGAQRTVSIDGQRWSAAEAAAEVQAVISSNSIAVLHSLDYWSRDAQRRVGEVVNKAPEHARRRILVTLRQPLELALREGDLAPVWATLFDQRVTWSVDPLTSKDPGRDRRCDTLLLARGFLVHTLVARRAFGNADETDELNRAKMIVFTSDAARYIRAQYDDVGKLLLAMQAVGNGLDIDADLLAAKLGPSDYDKVPLETILRFEPRDEPDEQPVVSRPGPGRTPPPANSGIPDVTEDQVADLAREYRGSLSRVAKAMGVPRSTLIRAWELRGLMDVWRRSGGRAHQK